MIRCQKRGERVVLNWNSGIRRWLRMEKKKKRPRFLVVVVVVMVAH